MKRLVVGHKTHLYRTVPTFIPTMTHIHTRMYPQMLAPQVTVPRKLLEYLEHLLRQHAQKSQMKTGD